MRTRRRVAVLLHAALGYSEGVLRGIVEYASDHPDWVTLWQDPEPGLLDKVRAWRPDGIIANLFAKPLAAAVLDLGVPVVSVSGNLHTEGVPRVSVCDEDVAAMAVDHLWSLGFRSFACLSTRTRWYHKTRDATFAQIIADRGVACSTFTGWYATRESLARVSSDPYPDLRGWLRGLPKPVALFGVQDAIALAAIEAAHECGIRVPDDMAVLGADNSQVLCMLANPRLSSVVLPLEEIGRQACGMLAEAMEGQSLHGRTVLLPPVRVAQRGSTDVVAVADEKVAMAMRYIRHHAHQPLSVGDLLSHVGISRRVLEQRFRRHLDCTPMQAIHRAQIHLAARLLVETDLPMSQIAQRAGFTHAMHLSTLFRAKTGTTPSAYRRQHHALGGP